MSLLVLKSTSQVLFYWLVKLFGVLLAMVVDCVSFYFVAAIDMNFAGGEGEEDCEDFDEEVQGHIADQGKPPLDAYL